MLAKTGETGEIAAWLIFEPNANKFCDKEQTAVVGNVSTKMYLKFSKIFKSLVNLQHMGNICMKQFKKYIFLIQIL